ncbi:MAG TPA: heparan N-sulfatase [Verrucomicrobiales bacterium]|nr:heparan N-sulfatase [Verrucomicrobiales bacterium]
MKRLLLPLLFALCPLLSAWAQPNILLILADDCTFSDLAIYGGQNAKTPNIDRLASQGLVFDKAYVTAAMCQPCRAELYTGQQPMRNGCAWNHSSCRPETKSLPHHLAPAGYRTGIAGKVHVTPKPCFPFEDVPGFDANAVRDPTNPHDLAGVKSFITRDKAQPFCLVVALTEPHVPWVMGDASKYPPQKLKLPPNIADTPKTREDFSKYLAEITYMDGQVGEILVALDESGAAQDTLVLFTSEQGSQFPGNKWTCWDTGLHTTLIARWPGKVAAGKRTSALVQYTDVTPTLLDIVGAKTSQTFDGTSFVAVLRGEKATHRDYAYAAHNNIPEGPAYPIRSITDGKWRYIRNLTPDEIFIEKHLMGLLGGSAVHNPYWSSWMATALDNPHTYTLVKRYMHRPAEQLYHTTEDAYEMTNLAGKPEHVAIKTKLSAALDQWLAAQSDPGIPQDTHEAHKAGKQGKHLHFPKP